MPVGYWLILLDSSRIKGKVYLAARIILEIFGELFG
jgi:hypothetical protein